jgi:hypothetical protein
MSLAAYVPATATVKVGDSSFQVKGLSSSDIGAVLENNLDELTLIFDMFKGGEPSEGEIALAIAKLPRMATALIAMGCAEEDTDLNVLAKNAARLPAAVQIDALLQIGKLTFQDAGGLGKFIESIGHLLDQIKPKLSKPKAQ